MLLYIIISSGALKSKIGQVFGGPMGIPVSVQQSSAVNGFFSLWTAFLSMPHWSDELCLLFMGWKSFFKALGTAIKRRNIRIYPVGYTMALRCSCSVDHLRRGLWCLNQPKSTQVCHIIYQLRSWLKSTS